ncbi:hypothetical protein [Bdellovibrio sp. HCB274]|uniref:hypothetical protein n=1 Tax=Bdellovibrio sp. HCB274 TaxID=3394361 RepID=UPI0039B659F5
MKYLVLMLTTLLIGAQTQAAVSSDEFVSQFVAQMNRRLVFLNQDRIASQKRPFCTGLSQPQIETIERVVRENSEQTARDFWSKLSPELKCYPIFLPPLKREGWGILLNTKAYWMDIDLIRDTLRDLGLRDNEAMNSKLLDALNP